MARSGKPPMTVIPDTLEIEFGELHLQALLGVPAEAEGLVIFAHGSGSGRLSPRNNRVAAALRDAGLATLLLDLLTPEEERDRANVFDIPLLASRLSFAADWSLAAPETAPSADRLFRREHRRRGGADGGGGSAFAGAGDRVARRAPRSRRSRSAARHRAHPADRRRPRYAGHRTEPHGLRSAASDEGAGHRAGRRPSVRGAGHARRGAAPRDRLVPPASGRRPSGRRGGA